MLRSFKVMQVIVEQNKINLSNFFCSGTPDLTLSFMNPRLMDDVSLHPCVRLKRWENERILSFVPPDGSFCLMSYHVGCQSAVAIPIYIRHNFSLPKENGQSQTGKIEITVGPRQTMGRVVKVFLYFM